MNTEKILGLLGLAISLVGGFVAIPYATLILVVAGGVVGAMVNRDDSVRIIVSAIALGMAVNHTLDVIPAIGTQLSAIVGGLAQFSAGAAVVLIVRNMIMRFKP
jgi:hypothetical protein